MIVRFPSESETESAGMSDTPRADKEKAMQVAVF